MAETYIIAGGDMRFAAAGEVFAERGRAVTLLYSCRPADSRICSVTDLHGIPPADYLILPLPVTADGIHLNAPCTAEPPSIEQLTPLVKPEGTVFMGRASERVKSIFSQNGIKVTDYLACEELAVKNAFATAEGAVMKAMELQDITLHGQKILIIGMGRIAKCLIRILSGFGADITAAARKSSAVAWAEMYGCHGISLTELYRSPKPYTLIFNTAPAPVIDRSFISQLDKSAVILDLASSPGGTDLKAAAQSGIHAENFIGIPGKTSPRSAGRIIAEAIENMIIERRRSDDR